MFLYLTSRSKLAAKMPLYAAFSAACTSLADAVDVNVKAIIRP